MCSTSNSFFATDTFYLNALHVLTAIEVPVHTFGAFIVVAKTPKKMLNVKWTMFLLHIVGAFLDVYLSFIASPVLTLPMCAGYPLGFSLTLGIPTDVQVFLGISFVGVIAVTILTFFEDRYYRLVHGFISNGSRNWKRKIWLWGHYILSFTFIIPGYMAIPDQTVGRQVTKQKIPCIPDETLQRQGYFVLAIENLVPCLCLMFMAFVVCSQSIYFVFYITRFLFVTVAKSQSTNRLQKQFFVALCIQVAVPLVVLFIPVSYIVLSIWFDYYNQAWTNISLVGISIHGVASTFTMLAVHKPYREATLAVFRLKRKHSADEQQSIIWKTRTGANQSQIL